MKIHLYRMSKEEYYDFIYHTLQTPETMTNKLVEMKTGEILPYHNNLKPLKMEDYGITYYVWERKGELECIQCQSYWYLSTLVNKIQLTDLYVPGTEDVAPLISSINIGETLHIFLSFKMIDGQHTPMIRVNTFRHYSTGMSTDVNTYEFSDDGLVRLKEYADKVLKEMFS